jgi:AcrR family transcriptional regulator
MSPKPDVSAERRQQIFEAALTCFGRKGYHLTTMDDIVAESGMSKGSLYWYFDSKKALFLALFQEMMTQFGQAWEAALAESGSSVTDRVRSSIDLFRTELRELVDYISVLMEAWVQTRHDQDVEDLASEYYQTYVDAMTKLIEEGMATGELTVESAEATALVIMILYDGIVLAMGTGLIASDWDRLMYAAERLILRGLGVETKHGSV